MRVRKSFIVKVSIAFILIMLIVNVVNYFKENVDVFDTPEEHFPKLYNASRYFFRVGYPNGWEHDGGSYGFLLNEETGLVVNLYPLIESPDATPVPTAQPDATALPEPMERDETAVISIYYHEFDQKEEFDLNKAMNMALEDLLNSDKGVIEDELSSVSEITTGKDIVFKKITYTYKKGAFAVKGEMYVAIRSMAYYIIVFEAEHDMLGGSSYNKYKDTFYEILEDFRFSVFDH